MRLLITGITGFVGSHMAEYALAQGAEVFGSARWRSRTENVEHLRGKVELKDCDLRDVASVRRLLTIAAPTPVIHLAAQSFVGTSWHTPAETLSTNIACQVNLLEGIRELKIVPRFLVIGTSEEYGLVQPDELPIRETNPLRPLSPYAVSKVAQDMMGFQYFKSYGLPIIPTRAFNHEGDPGVARCSSPRTSPSRWLKSKRGSGSPSAGRRDGGDAAGGCGGPR